LPLNLPDITRITSARSARVSSWDHTGRNQDYWVVGPGESRVLADLEGPGAVTHMWFTQFCRRILGPGLIDPLATSGTAPVNEIHNALGLVWEEPDPDYYRKIIIRMTYDNASFASVVVPLGDFFGVGHSMPANYESALFTVTAKPEEALRFGGSASLNSYLPLPFRERLVIEVVNENDLHYAQYFHIDYEMFDELPEDVGYLHAAWRRSNPCVGWGPDVQVNSPESNVANLTGDGNYVVLDVEGAGSYVGCNLSVYHRQGSWWGEGDDMIFVDDDTWPPSLHGTGTEDYFNHAWGMQRQAYAYHGAIVHEGDVPGYAVSYRFHVVDPIRFRKRIRVTIEHGHANHLSDDWSSTAYWYQLPPLTAVDIALVGDRLPTRPPAEPAVHPGAAAGLDESEIAETRDALGERNERFVERLNERYAAARERTATNERLNTEESRALRKRLFG
jgi:hypothetical protein